MSKSLNKKSHYSVRLQRWVSINGKSLGSAMINNAATRKIFILVPNNRLRKITFSQSIRAKTAPCLPNGKVSPVMS